MRYVYQIYLDKSFSRAAEHLFMTQPSLSIAVRREERRIGAKLFDRSERPLQLTQAGEAYIRAGEHLSARPKLPLERFRELEFILLQKGNNLHDRSVRMFKEAGFEPKIKLSLSQLVTAYRFAGQGLGATFVSDRIICAAPSENLLFYAISSPEADRLFHTLLPPRDYTAQAVKAFIRFAMNRFGVEAG